MSSDLPIRLLQPTDSLEELTELLHRAYAQHTSAKVRFAAVDQDVATTRQRIAGGECYVAVDGSRLVGTQSLICNRPGEQIKKGGTPWYDQPGVARLMQLAVDPAYQGHGLATRLMDRAEERARELGMSEAAFDTSIHAHRLIAWYQRRGYRIVDYAYWRTTSYCSVVMSKRLRADSSVRVGRLRRYAVRWRSALRQWRQRLLGR